MRMKYDMLLFTTNGGLQGSEFNPILIGVGNTAEDFINLLNIEGGDKNSKSFRRLLKSTIDSSFELSMSFRETIRSLLKGKDVSRDLKRASVEDLEVLASKLSVFSNQSKSCRFFISKSDASKFYEMYVKRKGSLSLSNKAKEMLGVSSKVKLFPDDIETLADMFVRYYGNSYSHLGELLRSFVDEEAIHLAEDGEDIDVDNYVPDGDILAELLYQVINDILEDPRSFLFEGDVATFKSCLRNVTRAEDIDDRSLDKLGQALSESLEEYYSNF